jgi:hypothetical protein
MDDFIKPEFLTYMVLLDPKLIVSLLVKGFSLDDTHCSRENGKLFMVVGTPGGSTIITSVCKPY